MANYSANYTQNTTSHVFGDETYKFSRPVSVINPNAIDTSCIFCGAENGIKYDYYPTYNLGTPEKALFDSKWSVSNGIFNYTSSAKDTPLNICFVLCSETGTSDERGQNTVYQIGKTIYNKASSANTSSMKVLNPFDLRKLIFRPSFSGYLATPDATMQSVDLKYLIEHPDDFFVQQMTMNVYAWNGTTYTNDTTISSIRPCIITDKFFIPVVNILGKHTFGMTDYNSRRDYTQAFYGTYDIDNMPMSFIPILESQKPTFDITQSSGGGLTVKGNKWKWSYNYYNSTYELYAPARLVTALMAHCGCYFVDNSYNTSGKTLNTFWNDDHIYLGEMKAGAKTTGVFIKGTDLLTSNTINKGAFSSQTDFDPSSGGAISDKEANMPYAYISGNAGMVTFYEINKAGLASADDISDAISRFDIAQIGKDLLRNFISFKAFAAISVDDTVDRQIKISGIGLEDSGGHELTGRVIGGVKPIDLFPVSGGVMIPTLYNDYRDYEPYTKIQMYVPFCGWFPLPSWCIGRKITGTMFTDLYNGTVKAIIYASQTVVAEVGGCCAYDIPFVADATGAKAGAVISSALNTAAAVGATVAMPNVATGIAAVSAAANLAATLNGNDTTLKGVLGDGSNLNGLLHVYIKVSRPKSPNGVTSIPDSYKHEIGIPTMKEIKISAGDGYIQVMDAKVNGTMTAREKQMIVDGFRHGLNF